MRSHPISPGQRFARLTVVSRDPDTRRWICRCDCGETTSVSQSNLGSGNQSSCGCLRLERLRAAVSTHGLSQTPEYGAWHRMVQRCSDSKVPEYYRYGGRGITVCPEWRDFERFLTDMGRRPFPGATLERVNNDLGYCPDNCRWDTRKAQSRNQVTNHRLTFNGETLSLAEWSERSGIAYSTLRARIRRGWSIDRAMIPIA